MYIVVPFGTEGNPRYLITMRQTFVGLVLSSGNARKRRSLPIRGVKSAGVGRLQPLHLVKSSTKLVFSKPSRLGSPTSQEIMYLSIARNMNDLSKTDAQRPLDWRKYSERFVSLFLRTSLACAARALMHALCRALAVRHGMQGVGIEGIRLNDLLVQPLLDKVLQLNGGIGISHLTKKVPWSKREVSYQNKRKTVR